MPGVAPDLGGGLDRSTNPLPVSYQAGASYGCSDQDQRKEHDHGRAVHLHQHLHHQAGQGGGVQEAHQKVADLVEAKEPKMLYFALHTSEDGSEATTVQVHADAENFGYHMSVVQDHVRAAYEYVDYVKHGDQNLRLPDRRDPRPDAPARRLRSLGDGQPLDLGLQPVRELLTDPSSKGVGWTFGLTRPMARQRHASGVKPPRRRTSPPPVESLSIPTRTQFTRRRA